MSYANKDVTKDEIKLWKKNKLINPRTNRKIKIDSKIYKYLEDMEISLRKKNLKIKTSNKKSKKESLYEDTHEAIHESTVEATVEDTHEATVEDTHESTVEDTHEATHKSTHEASVEDTHESTV